MRHYGLRIDYIAVIIVMDETYRCNHCGSFDMCTPFLKVTPPPPRPPHTPPHPPTFCLTFFFWYVSLCSNDTTYLSKGVCFLCLPHLIYHVQLSLWLYLVRLPPPLPLPPLFILSYWIYWIIRRRCAIWLEATGASLNRIVIDFALYESRKNHPSMCSNICPSSVRRTLQWETLMCQGLQLTFAQYCKLVMWLQIFGITANQKMQCGVEPYEKLKDVVWC